MAQELGAPMSKRRRGRMSYSSRENGFAFLSSFVPFRPSTDWIMSTLIGEGDLLYSVHQFKC